jgi:uncharacterized membrane-anchored protein
MNSNSVDIKVTLAGLLALTVYLLSFGLFVFATTSCFVSGVIEVKTALILLAVVELVMMPIADYLLDYYNNDEHRPAFKKHFKNQ